VHVPVPVPVPVGYRMLYLHCVPRVEHLDRWDLGQRWERRGVALSKVADMGFFLVDRFSNLPRHKAS
jgi:hypothetical protein